MFCHNIPRRPASGAPVANSIFSPRTHVSFQDLYTHLKELRVSSTSLQEALLNFDCIANSNFSRDGSDSMLGAILNWDPINKTKTDLSAALSEVWGLSHRRNLHVSFDFSTDGVTRKVILGSDYQGILTRIVPSVTIQRTWPTRGAEDEQYLVMARFNKEGGWICTEQKRHLLIELGLDDNNAAYQVTSPSEGRLIIITGSPVLKGVKIEAILREE